MKRKSFIMTVVMVLMAIVLPACGGSSKNGGEGGSSSSSSLSQYAGKWELFQVGSNPTESATFTVKISSNGQASISHYARIGTSETCLQSGDGYAELSGNNLYIEITSGKSKGTSLMLTARGGRLYLSDGQSLSKKY